VISRFAPSTTGEAHPGTLLSALLVWLDARARGGRVLLRLEDLDTTRVRAAWAEQLREACAWLGLDWDEVVVQSDRGAAHAAALDALAEAGRLYPCTCSRAARSGGRRAPDGSWAYENTCRARPLPPGGWRASADALRARLDDGPIALVDEGGLDLSQTPARDMGDPIVRRRDGVVAYQLAVVVDDGAAGITDIVRGRDIAPSTATQVALQRLLGLPTPRYRHHLLLLEPTAAPAASPAASTTAPASAPASASTTAPASASGSSGEARPKLAKLHGSLPFSQLRARHSAAELCGLLAYAAGLLDEPAPCTPADLVPGFDWTRVRSRDRVARWDPDHGLVFDDGGPMR
jgi:glutamyl-Q tRNA(Asp) synthetase